MKVKMTVAMAGDPMIIPGDEYECDDSEAARLIEAGYAIPIAPPKQAETAQKPKPAAKEKRG